MATSTSFNPAAFGVITVCLAVILFIGVLGSRLGNDAARPADRRAEARDSGGVDDAFKYQLIGAAALSVMSLIGIASASSFTPADVGLRLPTGGHVMAAWSAGGFALLLLALLPMAAVVSLRRHGRPPPAPGRQWQWTDHRPLVAVLALCVFTAGSEEFFARGLVPAMLESVGMTAVSAVAVTALVLALVFREPRTFAFAVPVGVTFLLTHSILIPVLLHLGISLLGVTRRQYVLRDSIVQIGASQQRHASTEFCPIPVRSGSSTSGAVRPGCDAHAGHSQTAAAFSLDDSIAADLVRVALVHCGGRLLDRAVLARPVRAALLLDLLRLGALAETRDGPRRTGLAITVHPSVNQLVATESSVGPATGWKARRRQMQELDKFFADLVAAGIWTRTGRGALATYADQSPARFIVMTRAIVDATRGEQVSMDERGAALVLLSAAAGVGHLGGVGMAHLLARTGMFQPTLSRLVAELHPSGFGTSSA